jgi:SAM-dependent methyltransferase
MDPKAMEPFGAGLAAYFSGDLAAELTFRRDDGQTGQLPVAHFFRDPSAITPLEQAALARCRGHVLDAGAGTGLHSLALQEKGLRVTAIDVNPQAVDIMRQRGIREVHCADLFEFEDGLFDTVLLMGHGIGMVETLAGLDRFVARMHNLVSGEGCVLLDSMDVHRTDDAVNLRYHEANRRSGRYAGEIRMQIEHSGRAGPYFGWLHVDPKTLTEHAAAAGWRCEMVHAEESGDYLASLAR